MHNTETFSLYPIHKSIGMLLFIVILFRVAWRIKNGWPIPVSLYSRIEQLLAKIVHWVLIIGTVMMPISGMLMSAAGGSGLAVFGVELMAQNPDLANPGKMIPLNESMAGLGHELHEIIAVSMLVAVVLHIAGALKHHIVDKDGTLRRILGSEVD